MKKLSNSALFISLLLMAACVSMDENNYIGKEFSVFSNEEGGELVSLDGIQIYERNFNFKFPILPGVSSFYSYETIRVAEEINITWVSLDGEKQVQTIERPTSIPAEIDMPCNLILYFHKGRWWIKYLENEDIYTYQRLVELVPTWHISE